MGIRHILTGLFNISVFSVGHHVSVWHYQWEVIWQYQELDTKYRRGNHCTFTILFGESFSWPFWVHHQLSSCSTLQQMWKGWSLETNVTSMTSDRCPKTEERRWGSTLWIDTYILTKLTWLFLEGEMQVSRKYLFSFFLSFAFSWRLIMESSLWRLVQRQTSMWRMWVRAIVLFTAESCIKFDNCISLNAPADFLKCL